jgi:hypothetical protein
MEKFQVTRPPRLLSILRLQRTVGNHSTQRILGIGDGEPRPAPPEAVRARMRWTLLVTLIALGAILGGGAAAAFAVQPQWIAACAGLGAAMGLAVALMLRARESSCLATATGPLPNRHGDGSAAGTA